jgi:hypothetical protein
MWWRIGIALQVVLVSGACSSASDDVARQRPVWERPAAELDSTGLRVIATDAERGTPIPVLVCFGSGFDTSVVADADGVATVHTRGGVNIWAWVRARGYHEEFLIFNPGRPGRMQVRVAMTRDSKSTVDPSCENLALSP